MKVSETHKFVKMEGKKVLSRIYVRIPEDQKKPVSIFRVWTRKTHRRKGLATTLIGKAVSEFGNRDMMLRVSPSKDSELTKEDLYKFYGKFGFARKDGSQTMIREF